MIGGTPHILRHGGQSTTFAVSGVPQLFFYSLTQWQVYPPGFFTR
jgi:hypothetical protein